MKKKVIIPIIVTLIVIIIGIFIGYKINGKNRQYQNKSILVSVSHSNYAWGITFSGSAIFDDGTIYSWDFNDSDDNDYTKYIGDNNIDTKKGLEKFILNKGNIKVKKVSNNDLEKIENYINNLTEEDTNFDITCHGADIGDTTISVYKNDEQLVLSRSGDCDGNSNSYSALKLLALIDKYLK